MRPRQKYHLVYTTFAILNANIGFLFFDYNLSIFNSLLSYLADYVFPTASSGLITFVASAPIITAAIAALFSGWLATKFGRRGVMLGSDVLAILGVVLTLFASLPVLILGRLLIGFNIGVTTVVVPLYNIEIPPLEYIGIYGVCLPIMGSIGILLAVSLGLTVPTEMAPGETSNIWRILQAVSILFALWRIINFLVFFRLDTPQYLLENHKTEKAKQSLSKVYKVGMEERLVELERDRDYVNSKGKVKFLELFTKKYRRALLVCVVIMSVQHLVGFNIFMVYAQRIFAAGLDKNDRLPQYLTIAFAGVFHLTCYSLIYFLNRFKRKSLLVYGTIGLGVIEVLFGMISKLTDPANIASKIILIFWPVPFILSLGSVPSILVPETLPEIGVSVAFLANWIWGFLTVQFFPDISDAIGIDSVFLIMGGICFVAAIYFAFEVVETKGRVKIEILQDYNRLNTKVSAEEGANADRQTDKFEKEIDETIKLETDGKNETNEVSSKSDVEAQVSSINKLI